MWLSTEYVFWASIGLPLVLQYGDSTKLAQIKQILHFELELLWLYYKLLSVQERGYLRVTEPMVSCKPLSDSVTLTCPVVDTTEFLVIFSTF